MEENFRTHLRELRNRLKHWIIVFAVVTSLSLYVSGDVLAWLQADLGLTLHALTAYETFYTRIGIGLLMGFVLSAPVLLYQLVKFAEPGLKPGEYRILRNYLPFSVALFVLGASFSYFYVVKYSLRFFKSYTESADVAAVWGLKNTIGFALKLSTVAGVLFQLPIVAVVLAKAGLISREDMVRYRAHFLITVLVIAAFATPPDFVTQLLVAVPVMGLYQLSILLVGRTA